MGPSVEFYFHSECSVQRGVMKFLKIHNSSYIDNRRGGGARGEEQRLLGYCVYGMSMA